MKEGPGRVLPWYRPYSSVARLSLDDGVHVLAVAPVAVALGKLGTTGQPDISPAAAVFSRHVLLLLSLQLKNPPTQLTKSRSGLMVWVRLGPFVTVQPRLSRLPSFATRTASPTPFARRGRVGPAGPSPLGDPKSRAPSSSDRATRAQCYEAAN